MTTERKKLKKLAADTVLSWETEPGEITISGGIHDDGIVRYAHNVEFVE